MYKSLIAGVEAGNMVAVSEVIKGGLDLSITRAHIALELAINNNDINVIDMLVDNGVPLYAGDHSAIRRAADGFPCKALAYMDFIDAINSGDSDQNITDMISSTITDGGYRGSAMVVKCASYGKLGALKKLRDIRGDLTVDNNAPLYEAVTGRHLATIKYLLANGADVTDRNGAIAQHALEDKRGLADYIEYLVGNVKLSDVPGCDPYY